MDKRAAEQYLRQIYGTQQGYVAVGYKDRDNTWHEDQFAWPSEKAKLLAWAERDSNIFICPALRRNAHTRKKGDMLPTRWLWADVDWQTVPADKLEEVNRRIAELGGVTVLSGSGDNVHVYVELSRQVDASEHAKLNTGLRDYLYADNKQADNSLLRLPGTTNWKTDQGSPVQWQKKTSRAMSPDALLKRRVFRDAKVPPEVEAAEWDFVPMDGVSKRVMRLVQMPVDESLGRYGKRHKAVWAVTKQLTRWGYGPDEVHSLMHTFPPALDKMAEENGYDPHLDIDRCLAAIRTVAEIAPDLSEQQQEEITEALAELSPSELAEEQNKEDREHVHKLAREYRLRNEASLLAKALEAERLWVAPPPTVSWSLTTALRNPPRPIPHLIEGLCGAKHNVVITAQYKTGKTAFTIGSIARALCDGIEFLDHFPVKAEGGLVVGHWNCEMDDNEMMDDYIRPVGIENTDNLNVANLRGYPVNILGEMGKRWAVQWLKGEIADEHGNYPLPCKVWTIDSFARLARMAGVSEKDNDEVMSLLMALDEIKAQAGIDIVFLIAHTGRMQHEEGAERARGATAIDDWCDARWIMTKVDNTRFLRVEGRGVSLPDSALVYDENTKHYALGFGGKTEVREETAKDAVVKLVCENPGISKSALLTALRGVGISNRAAQEPIDLAIDGGFIYLKEESKGGGKKAHCHYPVGSERPEGDRFKRATPGDVDLRGMGTRTIRRNRK